MGLWYCSPLVLMVPGYDRNHQDQFAKLRNSRFGNRVNPDGVAPSRNHMDIQYCCSVHG